MKAAVFYGARDMRIEDIEEPEIGPNDILVRVRACGICGSDLHAYRLGVFSRPGWVMGHELSGEVVWVGANVSGIGEGDRVVPNVHRHRPLGCGRCFWCLRGEPQWCPTATRRPCGKCRYCQSGQFYLCTELARHQQIGYGRNGGYAEYVRVANAVLNRTVFKLPDDLSFEDGAVLEPLQGAVRWVSLGEPGPDDVAVVLGAGAIGLCVMQVLKGIVSKVIVSEVSPKRLAVAAELGADMVINAREEDAVARAAELTGVGRSYSGRGGACADIVMECAGVPTTFQQALEMARGGGRVVLVGLFEEPVPINPNTIVHKALRLISSFSEGGEAHGKDLRRALEFVTTGRARTGPLVSHRFPLEQINEAFETQLDATQSIKVLIIP